jgi:hypothetical protein
MDPTKINQVIVLETYKDGQSVWKRK